MRRPLLLAWAALAVLCSASAIAQSDGEERFPGPDHLVPVDPNPAGSLIEYRRLCYQLLKTPDVDGPPSYTLVNMVRMPPFDPEECVTLAQLGRRDHRNFVLIHTRASRNIWYSMPENGPDDDTDEDQPRERPRDKVKQKAVKVVKTMKSLADDPARADRVLDLWLRMLRGVRYPVGDSGFTFTEDGETYEFRCYGMYGEASTPLKGPVKGLVDLGDAMIAVCDAPNVGREKSLARLDAACEALEKQLEAQAAKSKKTGATPAP